MSGRRLQKFTVHPYKLKRYPKKRSLNVPNICREKNKNIASTSVQKVTYLNHNNVYFRRDCIPKSDRLP